MGHSCILENTNAPTTADPRAESTRHGRIMLAGQLVIIIIALDWRRRGRGGGSATSTKVVDMRLCGHTRYYFIPIFDGTVCDYLTGTSLGRKTA